MSGSTAGEELPQLSVAALALSPAEERAYPRWYTDLLLRKRSEAVAIGDTLRFVDNFGLSDADKTRLLRLFGQPLATLDPAQFYAFLRLTSHVLEGRSLRRELAFVCAPVPKPRSILRKRKERRQTDDLDDDDPFRRPLAPSPGGNDSGSSARNTPEKSGSIAFAAPAGDMDSFVSLMTGRGKGSAATSAPTASRSRSSKRVTFDSRPPEIAEAAQRSMKELLRQRVRQIVPLHPPPALPSAPSMLQQQQHQQHQRLQQPSQVQQQQLPLAPQLTGEDEEPVPVNNFASVNIDSVLHHGHSVTPPQPAPLPFSSVFSNMAVSAPAPVPPAPRLTPNRTGPAEMASFGAIPQGGSLSSVRTEQTNAAAPFIPMQSPNIAFAGRSQFGIAPQHSGQLGMAQSALEKPSLLSQQNMLPSQQSGLYMNQFGQAMSPQHSGITLPQHSSFMLGSQQQQQQPNVLQQFANTSTPGFNNQGRGPPPPPPPPPLQHAMLPQPLSTNPDIALPAFASRFNTAATKPAAQPSGADFLQSVSAPPPPPPPPRGNDPWDARVLSYELGQLR